MLRIDINLLFTVVNVLVLCLAVRIFLWKPIHRILDERKTLVEKDFEAAAQAKAEADALAEERRAQLAGIDEERAAAVAEATRQANDESAQIVTDARARAAAIIEDAQVQARQEKDAILRSAQSEISDIIVAAAAKMIGAPTAAASDSTLYDQFLGKTGAEDEEKAGSDDE